MAANAAFLLMLRSFTKTLQAQIASLTSTTERLGQGEKTARVVALPFAATSGSVKKTADTLVVHPAAATFTRPLGDFTTLN